MHGRSGAAGRTCFDCKSSIGTRVPLSVIRFWGVLVRAGRATRRRASCAHRLRRHVDPAV
eukprot:143613-Prymnesium_polylepis.1